MKTHPMDRRLPKEAVERLRAKRQEMVARLEAVAAEQGTVMFERGFLTPDSVRGVFRAMRRRRLRLLLELVVLLFAAFCGVVLLATLLRIIVGL